LHLFLLRFYEQLRSKQFIQCCIYMFIYLFMIFK
jgi:hypothetical protein